MNFIKQFVIAYMFVFLVVTLLGLPTFFTLTLIPQNSNPVLNILLFFPNVIITVVNFLTFSTPYTLFNIILWSIRFIGVIEIVALIRGSS